MGPSSKRRFRTPRRGGVAAFSSRATGVTARGAGARGPGADARARGAFGGEVSTRGLRVPSPSRDGRLYGGRVEGRGDARRLFSLPSRGEARGGREVTDLTELSDDADAPPGERREARAGNRPVSLEDPNATMASSRAGRSARRATTGWESAPGCTHGHDSNTELAELAHSCARAAHLFARHSRDPRGTDIASPARA